MIDGCASGTEINQTPNVDIISVGVRLWEISSMVKRKRVQTNR